MSTISPSDMSDPDRNLATSFVALAEGVSVRPTSSTTTTTSTDTTNRKSVDPLHSGDNTNSKDADTETIRATVEGANK